MARTKLKRIVEFVKQETIPTRSDHNAVLTVWRINGVMIRIITWNFGPGTKEDLVRLINLAGATGVILLQESGDRGEIIRVVAKRYGYQVLDGSKKPGQSSTPALVGPRVAVRASLWRIVLDRGNVGPGAGPSHNKEKWWGGGRFMVDGQAFGASSIHIVASLQFHLRLLAGMKQARTIVKATVNRRVPWFVGGDWNAVTQHPLIRFMYRIGFTDNYRLGGEINTHGGRGIDRVFILGKWVK